MNTLLTKLIQNLKQQTLPEANPVDTLREIIPMSKEAAYRRLRGEINFTFEEAVKVAKFMNISLDSLAEFVQEECKYNVQMTCFNVDDLTKGYCKSMEEIINLIKTLSANTNPVVYISTNILLPFSYINNYETMSKFRLFKWTYRWSGDFIPEKMQDFIISPEIIRTENILSKVSLNMPINFICKPDLFRSYALDINHFRKINLLSEKEILNIKNETFSLLDDLERDTTTGKNKNGYPFKFFVCNSGFEGTNILFSSDSFQAVASQLFGTGFYYFRDLRITKEMKNWNNILIKNSTLISVSGEKQRFEFFRKQREFINEIL